MLRHQFPLSFVLFASLCALLASLSTAARLRLPSVREDDTDAFGAVFPVQVTLPSDPTPTAPVGAVAGLDTTIYIATDSGQMYLANIKTGNVKLLNPTADPIALAGLCLDSRGPGTLYSAGRETGYLTAFDRDGNVVQRYPITPSEEQGGNSFLSGCIQSRYQLFIVDSYNAAFYYLPLPDTGPGRGKPAPFNDDHQFQGIQVSMTGEWTQIGDGMNAVSVEWSQKFNETGFIMNHANGRLYAFSLTRTSVSGDMRLVKVIGMESEFPGAMGILFDSTNENVMYISIPDENRVAVLEFSRKSPLIAKFIRFLTSPLVNFPVAMAEYGDWIYPANGRSNGDTFSISQLPRHEQLFDNQDDPDAEFTTILDPEGQEISKPDYTETDSEDDDGVGKDDDGSESAESTSDPTSAEASPVSSSASPAESPSSVFASDNENNDQTQRGDDGSDGGCFPASATVILRSGAVVRMDELLIGDSVRIGVGKDGPLYSEVFLFSHQDRVVEADFLRIETSTRQTLELTPGHYMYVNGQLQAAKTAKVGDVIDSQRGSPVRVESISPVRLTGLYNPHTIEGSIEVNGVRVSTYTTVVEPVVASALLAPLRMVHACSSTWAKGISLLLHSGGGEIISYLPSGELTYA